MRLQEIERRVILARLRKHGGDKTATARSLGMCLRTLYFRLQRYVSSGHLTPQEADGWASRRARQPKVNG